MAICLDCGNSIDNGVRCAKCGGTKLRGVDPLVSGTLRATQRPTPPSDDGLPPMGTVDWDSAAEKLGKPPSRSSMRDVKRQARRRKLRSLWPF